jgi:hypothetical protein
VTTTAKPPPLLATLNPPKPRTARSAPVAYSRATPARQVSSAMANRSGRWVPLPVWRRRT